MPRFKPVHKGLKLLPIDFEKQIIPGTFEQKKGSGLTFQHVLYY